MDDTLTKPKASSLDPAIIVIVGISGDLSKRKVLPALYHLFKDNLVPEHVEVVGTSRRHISADELLKDVELCVLETDKVCDPDALARFKKQLHMVQLDPVQADDYHKLAETLNTLEDSHGVCMNRLYYLSIPPQVYGPVVRQLGQAGLNGSCRHGNAITRLLVEKPFGYDLGSAEELIVETAKHFTEEQVFRIDHYLAKESAQNILAFRAHNPVFAATWDNAHIDSIQVIAAEEISIEGRAAFYDSVGALRDLVQSHLLQLLTLTTMELPEDLTDSSAIHQARLSLLESIQPVPSDQVLERVQRAQYEGYRSEVHNHDSVTETFVNVTVESTMPAWQGVPFILTTGKALSQKQTLIIVSFKSGTEDSANHLTFRLQPNEGIDLQLTVKKPGFETVYQPVSMDFSYQSSFNDEGHPDAYERVLMDAIRGDNALFATSREVLASWHILQPILDEWEKSASDLRTYQKGATLGSVLA